MTELERLKKRLVLLNRTISDSFKIVEELKTEFADDLNCPCCVHARAIYSRLLQDKYFLEKKINFVKGRNSMISRGYNGVFAEKLSQIFR